MVVNKFTPEMLKTPWEHGSTIPSLAIKGRVLHYLVLKAQQRKKKILNSSKECLYFSKGNNLLLCYTAILTVLGLFYQNLLIQGQTFQLHD